MKEKLSVFVITHKQININNYPDRKILYVGQNNLEADNIKTFKDNTGENISNLNIYFSELTGLYWLWKNYKNCEYIGIEHYRRCFYKWFKLRSIKSLEKELDKADFLHFQTIYHPFHTQKQKWCLKEGKYLYPILLKAIETVAPEYLIQFNEQMKKRHCIYCNIFICKKEYFDKYMEFMFKVLFLAQKYLNTLSEDQKSRSLGFMAERLFETFVSYNKFTHKSLHCGWTHIYKIK